MAVEKYIRDGKVAVLYSPEYGASWNNQGSKDKEGMLFDKDIVEAILSGDVVKADAIAHEKYGLYAAGAENVKIKWLDVGTVFRVNEDDGFETIEIYNSNSYTIA